MEFKHNNQEVPFFNKWTIGRIQLANLFVRYTGPTNLKSQYGFSTDKMESREKIFFEIMNSKTIKNERLFL